MLLMIKTLIEKSINILHNIKIPSIPPILASGKAITNSVEKAN